MKILYLEDNPNDAELTLRVFKSHDPRAKLITAGDVHTALGIIQSHPADYFDIFLSDFELPDGDAIQFLEAIHQRGLFQPVVVVTGNDDPQVRNRTLAQGIAGFLYKEGKYLETLPEKIEKIHKSYRENRKRQSVIRVLYAEHNPVDAELTQLHFASHAAHIVLQVISSATELERTCQPGGKNPEYDVIVLDTNIQRQGDLSLLQKLKAEWKIEQPVILLTAPGEDRRTVQALQMGAENCVIKNIGYFQLLPAIIEVAFTKSRLMKEQKISLERERLFRLMTENARDIVFRLRFSPDFGFDYISAAVKRLTGYSPEEFYENPSLLIELVDPEDFTRLQQMLAKPTRFGKPILLRWHTRDGRLLWVEAKGSFVHDSTGKFVALEGIARDITERIRFESALQAENERRQELETIINKSPVIVVRWKPKIRQPLDYISANISSLGYKAKDFLDGKILYEDIVHPDDVEQLESEVSQHAQAKDMQYRMRYRLITKKGETRWIDDLTWVVKDDQGTSLYHQGIVTDITLEKKVEEEEQRRAHRSQNERQSIIQLALDPSVSSGDFDVAIQHLTENVANVLGVERASVWMYTEGEDGILCTDLYERSKNRHSKGLILQARDYPTYFESLRAGRAIAAQHARSDPRTFEFTEGYLQPLGIASLLDSAIRVRSQMVGVVCFEHIGEPRHWHQDEITYGGEIADQVAQVILNLERHTAEEATRSNEVKFRTIIEQSAEGFVLLDADGFVIDWNRTTEKLFEIARKDAIGHYFWDLLYRVLIPERRTGERYYSLKKAIQAALKRDQSPLFQKPIEAEIVNLKGEHVFIQQTIFPLFISGQRFLGSFIQDFTEQKNAQMALQRRDEIMEAVSFTATRLLVAADWKKQAPIILEKLGRAAHVDRVYLLEYPNIHHGISLSEITDNLIEWVAPGVEHRLQDVSLPGLSDFSQAMNRWKTTLTRGEMIVAAPGKIPKNEQSFLDVLGIKGMMLVPILLEGTLWGLLGFDQVTEDHPWDETEMEALKTFADTFASAIQRNKAYEDLLDRETRLHAILEASKDAILVSIHDTTVYANTAFRKLFGLSLQDDLEDTSIESLIAPTDRKRYREISQDRQNGKPAPTHYELKALKKNSAEFNLEIYLSTYELMGETYTLALLRDITDKKQHDRELEALASVSTALRKARTREEMFPIIVDQLVKVMQADGGLIMLEEPIHGDMVVHFSCGEFSGQEGLHIPAGQGISGEVKRTKKPYVSHNLLVDPLFFRAKDLNLCKEAVFYPTIAQKKVTGTLLVSRDLPFDKTEIKVIGSIAEMAANAIFRSELHEQTESQLQKLIALRQIDNAISSTLDVHQIIDTILTSSQKFLKVDAADILLYDEESRKLNFAYGVGFRTNLMKGFAINSGEGWAGEAFRKRKPIMVPDINQVSDKQINPAPPVEELVSYYVIPLITSNQVKGVMECFTRSPLHLDQDWEEFINLLAGQAAIAINSAQLFDEIKHSNLQLVRAYDDTIEGWSRAMDIRDKETEGHTLRVVDLTLRLARSMGIPEDQLTHIKRGTLLHDIGKLVVPDSILFKPSSLNDLEWKIMKKHPLNAYKMLGSVDYLKPALDIPYCHHEHWDGSGYPCGLKGEEIPLAARIFSVVDIWDALLSDRPYRPAWTREKTLAYIKSRAGEDLDPKVVKVFLKIISESK